MFVWFFWGEGDFFSSSDGLVIQCRPPQRRRQAQDPYCAKHSQMNARTRKASVILLFRIGDTRKFISKSSLLRPTQHTTITSKRSSRVAYTASAGSYRDQSVHKAVYLHSQIAVHVRELTRLCVQGGAWSSLTTSRVVLNISCVFFPDTVIVTLLPTTVETFDDTHIGHLHVLSFWWSVSLCDW